METKTKEISAKELKQKIQNNEDLVLINVLSPESFCARHIPGSINIPVDKMERYAKVVVPDTDQEVVTYCKNVACKASGRAAETLEELGYKNITHYAGGLEGWEEEGYQLIGSGEEVKDEKC